MNEKHFVFLKNNRVEQILVFSEQDNELANRIVNEEGYDDSIWIGEDKVPDRWSIWYQNEFIPPTLEYLHSIGVLSTDPNLPINND